ncbi:MAG: site-2 protease family protein [Bacilli bacterium]
MKIIKIDFLTYYFLLIAFFCGFIKLAIIAFLIVFFHELGHILFIKLFGYKINSVTIYPFGGITKVYKDINTSINKELLIAFGGVLFQTLIYIIPLLGILSPNTNELIIKYNTSILLFNLIPIIPLDGSIIFNLILNKFNSFKNSYFIEIIISFIFIIFFLSINYIYSLNNYFIVIFLIFKTFESIKNYKYIYNKFLLERFINNYSFKNIRTSKGNLNILKKETYQYFLEDKKVVSEKVKLQERFDNNRYF